MPHTPHGSNKVDVGSASPLFCAVRVKRRYGNTSSPAHVFGLLLSPWSPSAQAALPPAGPATLLTRRSAIAAEPVS